MTDEARPRPFHERFDIEVGMDDARQRFINRITNLVLSEIYDGRLGNRKLAVYKTSNFLLTKHVANRLGELYDGAANPADYVQGDFFRCLNILEVLYEALQVSGLEDSLSEKIEITLGMSEVDLELPSIGW